MKPGPVALVSALSFGVAAGAALADAACAPDRLDLRWDGGRESLAVEVADDGAERAKGLMFRQKLDTAAGMLFVYESPRRAQFWMKNTLIPLDLIFIREDGSIARIAENAVPLSLDPIPSLEPVSAVLEIAGGRSAELGIKAGDKVSWEQ